MSETNSFYGNMSELAKASEEMLNVASAFNKSIGGNEAEVVLTDSSTVLPSYSNVLQRVERAERTIANFTLGKGVVQTADGTYRKISVDNVSRPASNIGSLGDSSKFGIDANWFFESFQFPRCVVRLDLKGKVDDNSDRAYVSRIIVNSTQEALNTAEPALADVSYGYNDMIQYLENNGISYKEDRDEVKLPLTYEKHRGSFQILGITLENDSNNLTQTWYYLDTINYNEVDENGNILNNSGVLAIGDRLRFNNSLFKVVGIDQLGNRIRLEYNIGYDTLNTYDSLEYYNEPFSEKIINVGVSINEYDIIYVKGVNENFNVLSNEWSDPLIIYTNDLTMEGDNTTTLYSYYVANVADFGQKMIAEFKEGRLPAYGSKTPSSPVLSVDDVRVVQINTQLEATLDSERYNNITTEIASLKSNITAVRTTISANKDKLIQETSEDARETIQNSINSDTNKLNNLTTQFSSLVEELNTLLNDAGAINYTPKYHVRGFFAIPDPQYLDPDNKTGKQNIIGFETLYRYLHTDETGTRLNTFDFADSSTGLFKTVVFTDLNQSVSPFLEKKYNPDTDKFEWIDEKVDGTHVSINQIDVPIRNGEKVEIKVRSISEAGYPYAPMKSEWSNSIIVEFPNSLTTDDSVTTILQSVKSDMTSVVLQETLSAAGIYTHIADSNSMFKHDAKNIEYTETENNGGVITIKTMSLADKIKALSDSILHLTLSGDSQVIS